MSRRKQASEPAAPIQWAGWYSVDREGFWAAWWSGEPTAGPWRAPDATGWGPPENAERRIRTEKGQGALIRRMGDQWAAAAKREAAGGPPRYQEPKQRRVKDVFYQTSKRPAGPRRRPTPDPPAPGTAAEREHRARMYWSVRDACTSDGRPCFSPRFFGFDTVPERPKDMGPEPAARAWAGHDPFAVLGLTASATAEDVKRAYRKIVAGRRLHPDQGGDPAIFREVTAHRDLALSAVERRGAYH